MSLVEVLAKCAVAAAAYQAEPADDYARVCRLMEAAIAAAFAVPVDELRAPSRRTQTVAFARQSAMYLAHVVLGLNYSATGMLFHRDRTTAAHACQVVEDRRDDPAIDRLLQQAGRRLPRACRRHAATAAGVVMSGGKTRAARRPRQSARGAAGAA